MMSAVGKFLCRAVHFHQHIPEVFPIVFAQIPHTDHVLKQIVCHCIKEDIAAVLHGIDDRRFSGACHAVQKDDLAFFHGYDHYFRLAKVSFLVELRMVWCLRQIAVGRLRKPQNTV